MRSRFCLASPDSARNRSKIEFHRSPEIDVTSWQEMHRVRRIPGSVTDGDAAPAIPDVSGVGTQDDGIQHAHRRLGIRAAPVEHFPA